jgi:hypothetical protein
MNNPLIFDGWELQYLQQTMSRWHDYKGHGAGGGTFSDRERILVSSIKTKVQVVAGTPVSFTPEENNFLQTVFYQSRQDYGRGSGGSVFETGVRNQVQQRAVYLNASILAKLRGNLPLIIAPLEQSDPGALS